MQKQKATPSPIVSRVKAFIIDMFFIAAPLLYFATYIILDGKNDFQHSQITIFSVWAVFGVIESLFFAIKAQTPGYKSQNIYVVNLRGGRANFFVLLFRYLLFVAFFIVGGSLFCFFRKDKRNLHDILSQTISVAKKSL